MPSKNEGKNNIKEEGEALYRTIEHTEQADMTPPTPKQSQKKKKNTYYTKVNERKDRR